MADQRIDLTYLKEFSNGDKIFERDILESSLLEAEEKIQALDILILKKDFEKIKLIAHSLKSLMSVMGCSCLQSYFYDLEHCNEISGKPSNIIVDFTFIKDLWNREKMKIESVMNEYNFLINS